MTILPILIGALGTVTEGLVQGLGGLGNNGTGGDCPQLANVVEGDQKAPLSIATTTRCIGGRVERKKDGASNEERKKERKKDEARKKERKKEQ